MLPQPNLDDRLFEQMVQEARKSIPKFMPEWTDENAHDPGITFIELFAWLSEMQQYYLSQITERQELKFLKMLGYKPREAQCAKTDVTFNNHCDILYIPEGTKLRAEDQLFETVEPLTYIPARIDRIVVRSETEANDYTSSNDNEGVAYYAFGREVKTGNRLYIAFDQPLPMGEEIVLSVQQFEEYSVKRGDDPMGEITVIPSAKVSWKFYGSEEENIAGSSSWMPLTVVQDDTLQMSQSGRIRFQVPYYMRSLMIHPANDRGRYWICCTVEEEGFELSPKIDQLCVNTVTALQQETISEVHHFASNGEAKQSVICRSYLASFGMVEVQVREQGKWIGWEEIYSFTAADSETRGYTFDHDAATCTVTISFGDGINGMVPPDGQETIRLICYSPEFYVRRFLGKSNGLPNQQIELKQSDVIPDSLLLQVGYRQEGTSDLVWEDWQRVDDFDNSGPSDRHYLFDPEKSLIIFGNNEHGMIPESGPDDQLVILACKIGGGSRGNVKKNLVTRIIEPREGAPTLSVSNRVFASGGTERETLAEAKLRLKKDLKKPSRAVTGEDYEEIVRRTPGLRVARVKAIPLYRVGMADYPYAKAAGQMTVVVVPYSEEKTPLPSKGFIQTVKQQLDKHRLITTEIHVIPPEYVKVTVHAVVVVEPRAVDDAHKIKAALEELLQPLDSTYGQKGWSFGQTVYKGDIYGAINRIPGVSYIQDLWLNAEGMHTNKTPSGDIRIPPYGLVYSGEHEIELISQTDV